MATTYPAHSHVRRQPSPTPQIRHSCDACNIAKVKCSKTRPECARCESRKLACVYSVSLRSAKGKAENHRNARRNNWNQRGINEPKSALTSAPMAFPTPMVPHPMMPHLSETGFDDSILDGWNTAFSEMGDPPTFSEHNEQDEEMNVLPHPYTENGNSGERRHSMSPGQRCKSHPGPLDVMCTRRSSEIKPPLSQTCFCQQNVLSKLSECWLPSLASTIAFDKSLSENKSIINLCTSTLNCSNRSHADDTILMLTVIALLTQVVTIYDSLLPANTYSNSVSAGSDNTLTDSISVESPTHSPPSTINYDLQSPSLAAPQHVRLSLGSYQLDHCDEQILKANLLGIELGKIGDLIDLYERRFCSPNGWGGGVSRGEKKPFGELVSYLRRRLRTDQERVRAWGSNP